MFSRLALVLLLAGAAVAGDKISPGEAKGRTLTVEGLSVTAPSSGSWTWTTVDKQPGPAPGTSVRLYHCNDSRTGAEMLFEITGPHFDAPAQKRDVDGIVEAMKKSATDAGMSVENVKIAESELPRASSYKYTLDILNPKAKKPLHLYGYATTANGFLINVASSTAAKEPGSLVELAKSLKVGKK